MSKRQHPQKLVLKIFFGFSILVTTFTNSICRADTWTPLTHITQVYPQNNGSFVITIDLGVPACKNASNPQYFLVQLSTKYAVTSDGIKAMLATSLATFALKGTVQINFDETDTSCVVNRLVIGH